MEQEIKSPQAEASEGAPAEAVKKRDIFRAVLRVLTLLLLAAAIALFCFVRFLKGKEKECRETVLPTGLSAVETVERYFRYWDEGNNAGMRLIGVPELTVVSPDEGDFSFGACYFCDVTLDRCEKAEGLMAEGFEGCFESAIVTADFTYKRSMGFGDAALKEKNTGWEFYLARPSEGDPFRIMIVKDPGRTEG